MPLTVYGTLVVDSTTNIKYVGMGGSIADTNIIIKDGLIFQDGSIVGTYNSGSALILDPDRGVICNGDLVYECKPVVDRVIGSTIYFQ